MLEVKIENGRIYSHIRGKWLFHTPEEEVRQRFVCWLVNNCGYPLENMVEEYKNQYSGGRGVRKTRADIVIFRTAEDKEKNYNAYIVVECKSESVRIRKEDFYQGTEYAQNLRAQFLVLHNSRETVFYSVDMDKIPNKDEAFTQIVAIPKYGEIDDSKKVEELKNQTKAFTREEFTDLLWRCHNIIRNNDKLSPEAAFDEIGKLLFIKISFERRFGGAQVFTLEEFNRQESDYERITRPAMAQQGIDKSYMQVLFDNTKIAYGGVDLFENDEIIRIKENSFRSILALLQKYNLSDTSDDVKGIAFEKFLGRTFRGELGQFFTPRTVVNFMTELLDPCEGELICDPCCGSGGFLISAFDYIKEKIERDIQAEKEYFKSAILAEYSGRRITDKLQIEQNERIDKIFGYLNMELEHLHTDENHYYSRLDELSYNTIFGTDANPRMARTSKMNMIMHGDGHSGVYHHDGLINIDGIFENRFDVILTNPPFGASVSRDQTIDPQDLERDPKKIAGYTAAYGSEYRAALDDLERRASGIGKDGKRDERARLLLGLYDTGKMSTLTEVLFIERCIRLLRPGGRMGIVLPEGVLNNSNLHRVREYFEGKAKLIFICSIPQDVFVKSGASVKPSLVFMKKFTAAESEEYAAAVEAARREVEDKYAADVAIAKALYADKETKTQGAARLAELKNIMQAEQKRIVRERFDYEIPIAKVEHAGITATGRECENELDEVLEEFKLYNADRRLWSVRQRKIRYYTDDEDRVFRIYGDDDVTWLGDIGGGANEEAEHY